MKRPLGVTVLAVCALLVALLYVARVVLNVVGADIDFLAFSLAGFAVFAVVFLLVGGGFLAGQAWSWVLALLLIGWHVSLRVLSLVMVALDGHLSLGGILAVVVGLAVWTAIPAAVGLYLARRRVQRSFGVQLRGRGVMAIVCAAAVVAVVTRGLQYSL